MNIIKIADRVLEGGLSKDLKALALAVKEAGWILRTNHTCLERTAPGDYVPSGEGDKWVSKWLGEKA